MSAEALRTVFAELGFNVDLKSLEAANKVVDKVIEKAKTLVGATKEVDKTEEYLSRRREARKKGWQTSSPQGDKLSVGGDKVDSTAWKQHIARLQDQAAWQEKEDRAAAQAKVRADIAAAQAKNKAKPLGFAGPERPRLGGVSKAWEAAKSPVTGLMDLLGRFEDKAQSAFGKKLPAAVQTFMGKLGIARTDFATMARVAGTAALTVIGVLHRAASAAFDFAAAFTADAEALRETAREARVTSSELQALQHAGAQSGVGADRVTRSITAFGQKLRDAHNRMAGGSGVSHTLRRLGISMRDASGQVRPTVELLDEVAVAMEHISSPRRRIRVAESLGLDRRMLDILHTGAGGIRALREEMEALGGGVSPEATEAARQYARAQERLRVATTSVRSVLFVALAPALQWVIDKSAMLTGWFSRMTRGTQVFQIALTALGAVAAVALGSVVAGGIAAASPFILAALAVAALVIIVDDLVAAFNGGDSAIGRFLDSSFGLGTTATLVEDLTEVWEAFKEVLVDVKEVLEFILGTHRRIAQHVGGTFRGAFQAVRRLLPGGGTSPEGQPPQAPPEPEEGGLVDGAYLGGRGAGGRPQRRRRGQVPTAAPGEEGGLVDGRSLEAPGWMRRGAPTPSRIIAVPQAIPASRIVAAGGGGRERGRATNSQTLHFAPGAIQANGVSDPRRAAELVVAEIQRQARQARDRATVGGEE